MLHDFMKVGCIVTSEMKKNKIMTIVTLDVKQVKFVGLLLVQSGLSAINKIVFHVNVSPTSSPTNQYYRPRL